MGNLPRTCALLPVLLMALVAGAQGKIKLPRYLKTCSRNDPNLNDCVLKSGKEAIAHLLPGDPSIRLPRLDPLRMEEIKVEQEGSVGLHLLLKDVDLIGLGDSDLKAANFDLKEKVLGIDLFAPRLQLIGKYNISGRILILPIHGNGDSNITLENVPLKYSLKYSLENRKGKEYMRILDKKVNFDTSQAHFTFENLFNGDERLRENVRRVVNENWRQVIEDIGPSVASAIGDVVTQLLRNFLTALPYDDIFPDTPV